MGEVPDNLRRWDEYFRRGCPLRKALDAGAQKGMHTLGWLCMNRNYGEGGGAYLASRFWRENREKIGEVSKDGVTTPSRLCYYFPEYRRERLDVVLAAAKVAGPISGRHLGAIVLDFCRQPPMLMYHPEMCRAYEQQTGQDPRQIKARDVEAFLRWCQWRADILTEFMREVRSELMHLGDRIGAPIRLSCRITDLGPNINLIEGIDIRRWCREGLIDSIVTSNLNWMRIVLDHDLRPYVALVREHNIPVIAGVNMNRQTCFLGVAGAHNPLVLARRVVDYQQQGAHGIAMYQSESGLEYDGMDEVIPALAEPERARALLNDEGLQQRWPVTHLNSAYGLDCHSWFNDWTIDGEINPI